MHRLRHGFTLIEFSIVLILIGFVAAGVLVGNDVIRTSKLRSLHKQVEEIKSAVRTFQQKYDALPGDMANATSIWPEDSACPESATPNVPKIETCNGNGDGLIRNLDAKTEMTEPFRAIQQLANAGLIAGKYSGLPNAAGNIAFDIPGVTMLLGSNRISGGPYEDLYDGNYPLAIQVGKDGASCESSPCLPFLTAAEAWGMDIKYDDGKPGMGLLRSYKSSYAPALGCTSSDIAESAQYNAASEGEHCAQIYRFEK